MLKAGKVQRPTSGGCSQSSASLISVAVVDDHPVVRLGVSILLEEDSGLHVVGDASTTSQAWEMVFRLRPDVVLLDLELEEGNTCELIARMEQAGVDSRVVVYTAHEQDSCVLEALRSGASGYILKGSRQERLFEAIRTAAAGGVYLDPAVASKVVGRLGFTQDRHSPLGRELTKREGVVLRELASGRSNKEIANRLFITERTVKYHVNSLFTKLRARNRTQALRAAIEQGLIKV